MEQPNLTQLTPIAATCACFHLRKASRAVTQLFAENMKSSGLQVTQFTILVAVAIAGSSRISDLAEDLVMDRTTLTRALKPLVKRGLIVVEPGRDRRIKVVSLTAKGYAVMSKAVPFWQEAQAHVVDNLGDKKWNTLLTLLETLSENTNILSESLSERCIYT
ncbi:MarR family winged helix-turn-helix transcriptional regulator [Mastigocoleus sp. MO_188.B34]|uniref:MarR family winged helix-turn-helix transcriptional regulator n=1 Tax=Mastigocoleus sp. MO_188.B34 TaxID=3036635 RepID=UPI00262E3FF3|nr:MarR family winged helix-turn-helix transcriptional regulator [Mastigocoleus sp. MO_188.B34]MDJ0696532.1 MarR family winged helix-turn-helix transcriptional regulator [Mastigocoleus sp. MO_188.B34]